MQWVKEEGRPALGNIKGDTPSSSREEELEGLGGS